MIFHRFADLLFNLKIGYNTAEGRRTARLAMSTIQETAHKTSHELALAKGVFPNWEKSIYGPSAKNVRMRNAALTNVAPTGTISMMFDVSGGVSLHFDDRMPCMGVVGNVRFCRLCQFGFFLIGILLRISSRAECFDVALRQNLNSPPLVLGAVEHARIGLAMTTTPTRH